MDDQPARGSPEEHERRLPMTVAMGAAFGPLIGVLLLAITGEAIWLALSPGFGVIVAVLYHVISRPT